MERSDDANLSTFPRGIIVSRAFWRGTRPPVGTVNDIHTGSHVSIHTKSKFKTKTHISNARKEKPLDLAGNIMPLSPPAPARRPLPANQNPKRHGQELMDNGHGPWTMTMTDGRP